MIKDCLSAIIRERVIALIRKNRFTGVLWQFLATVLAMWQRLFPDEKVFR